MRPDGTNRLAFLVFATTDFCQLFCQSHSPHTPSPAPAGKRGGLRYGSFRAVPQGHIRNVEAG